VTLPNCLKSRAWRKKTKENFAKEVARRENEKSIKTLKWRVKTHVEEFYGFFHQTCVSHARMNSQAEHLLRPQNKSQLFLQAARSH
jgi:hypothetical protein